MWSSKSLARTQSFCRDEDLSRSDRDRQAARGPRRVRPRSAASDDGPRGVYSIRVALGPIAMFNMVRSWSTVMAPKLSRPLREGLNKLLRRLRRRYRSLDERDFSAAIEYACDRIQFGFCPTFSTILDAVAKRATAYCDEQVLLREYLQQWCGERGAELLEEIGSMPASARAAFHRRLVDATGGIAAWLDSRSHLPATVVQVVQSICQRVQPRRTEFAVPVERAIGQTRKPGSHRGPP